MKFSHSRNMNCNFKLLLKSVVFASVVVSINGYPQWVWSKDAIDLGSSGSGTKTSSSYSDSIRSPAQDSTPYIPKGSVRIINDQSQSRLLFSSITNALPQLPSLGSGGGGGGSSSGALGGLFGSVLQTIAAPAINGISAIFNRPGITLPGNTGNIGNSADKAPAATGSCNCVEASACFLPNKATGSCSGGKVTCCSTSRTLFPDDDSSNAPKKERTVTQREVRQGLLKNILKGSGSIVDDTLDLVFHRFLSPEDQRQTAKRILGDE